MSANRLWGLDIRPVYEDYDPVSDGMFYYGFDSVLKAVRVAVKFGTREVLVFHAVRPEPAPSAEEDYIFTYRSTVDPKDNPNGLALDPLNQLIADAELGRRAREAGLELK